MKTGFVVPGFISCCGVCCEFHETSSAYISMGKRERALYGAEIALECFKCLTYKKTKLHGLSPRANNTDRATAACRQNDCQLLWIEGATWSA
jgi:hypothetical protein